jgi:hypothetical protein
VTRSSNPARIGALFSQPKEASMRPALLAAAIVMALTLVAPTAGQAQIYYPWCAQYGGMGGGGGRNCGFVSYAQCMATVSGIGGFCERNSFYTGPERPARRLKKVRPD